MTLELETLSASTIAGRSAPHERLPVDSGALPWHREDGHWKCLEPRGLYVRLWRARFLWAVACLMVAPAMLLALPIAFANRLEHGSWRRVLFAQPRVGWRGRVFVLFKFRTMADTPGEDHARVTPFGRFLRNTHLDELPQLLNVLRGEMCLIGPRPEMLSTERWAARHCPDFCERLVLPPGLTGYAQITQGYTQGGDQEAYQRKLELNRCYRERVSLLLDLAILGRTSLWMLRGRGWQRGSR